MQGARYKDPITDQRVILGGAKAEKLAKRLEALGWEKLYPVTPAVKPTTVTVEKSKVSKFPAVLPQAEAPTKRKSPKVTKKPKAKE